jgi:hypothetical protein
MTPCTLRPQPPGCPPRPLHASPPLPPPHPTPREGLNDGLSHMFIMTFESEAARDAYLPHPEHEAFKATWVPSLARVVVLDIQPR